MYRPGWRIVADDYNQLIGGKPSDVPASSESAASGKIADIWGVGYGQYGFGQRTEPWRLRTVTSSNRVIDDDWYRLRDACARMLNHFGLSTPDLPPPDTFDAGDEIRVHDSSAGFGPGDFDALAPILDAEVQAYINDPDLHCQLADPSKYAVAATVTDVRGSSWGSGDVMYISSAAVAIWPDGDAARAFWNAGGEIRIRPSHPVTTNPNDVGMKSWLEAIDHFLVRRFDCRAPAATISPRSPSSRAVIGYWNSTSTMTEAQPEFYEPWPPYGFYNHTFLALQAWDSPNVSGNGDNGSILIVEVIIGHRVFIYDPAYLISPGTVAVFEILAPTSFPDTSIIPTFVLYNSFDSAGPIIQL